jgi:uncharacterized protein YjbI with pentapeptide repeats
MIDVYSSEDFDRKYHHTELELDDSELTQAELEALPTPLRLVSMQLNGLDFTKVDLRNAFISDCEILNSNFNNCVMRNAALFLTEFIGCNLTNLDLTNSVLDCVWLSDCDTAGLDLTNADIDGGNLHA